MRWAIVIAACLLVLPAQASAQSKLFQDYRNDGQINPCDYSPGELKRGLSGLPPDVEAYVPGLNDQLRRGCGASGGGGGGQATPEQQAAVVPAPGSPPPPGASATSRNTVPRPPATKPDARNVVAGTAPSVPDGPLPEIPAWMAAILVALTAGALTLLALVRYGIFDPSGLARSLRTVLARR
jgi:hypothetical protein